jgi:hypothetical protein
MVDISNSKVVFFQKLPFLETIAILGITIKGNYDAKKSENYQKKS